MGERSRRAMKKKIFTGICIAVAVIILLSLSINFAVVFSARGNIITEEEVSGRGADVILVLGCGVKPDGRPSDMLRDRLICAIDLYNGGAGKKLLLTGDSAREGYDEVGTMKSFYIDRGVAEDDIITDPLGLSTFESISRAKELYNIESAVIVTQKYHLYRAVYIAQSRDIDACGVSADLNVYGGQLFRDIREIPARIKDFVLSKIK